MSHSPAFFEYKDERPDTPPLTETEILMAKIATKLENLKKQRNCYREMYISLAKAVCALEQEFEQLIEQRDEEEITLEVALKVKP